VAPEAVSLFLSLRIIARYVILPGHRNAADSRVFHFLRNVVGRLSSRARRSIQSRSSHFFSRVPGRSSFHQTRF